MNVRSVLFVCSGNTCRSPMAAALLRHMLPDLSLEVVSRGTSAMKGAPLSTGAAEALIGAHIPVPEHVSRPLSEADVDNADHIYAMTQEHLSYLVVRFPAAKGKAQRLTDFDIADPIGGSKSDYEKCRIDIQNALLGLISKLKSEGSSKS